MQTLTILGSTGSIGQNTLDVVARHPARYRLHALTAANQVDRLVAQCAVHRPRTAVIADIAQYGVLREGLRAAGLSTEAQAGTEALAEAASAPEVDAVMAAIVGVAGMLPTLAAARAGKRILLANKEALVMAGALFMQAVRQGGATLLPIDSEHNAIYQCLPPDFRDTSAQGVQQILLTASGGPFRQWSADQLAQATPEQAVQHPNWKMGRKISVDSASLMNKGLEVIEAHWLFGLPPERIAVVLHPQSIIHSLVSYRDGSVLAQLGNPDMRTPIAYGLAWPERIDAGVRPLDLCEIARLDFFPPDTTRFPCLALAFEALYQGAACPALLNAANEMAITRFLAGSLRFTEIPRLNAHVMRQLAGQFDADSLDSLHAADAAARRYAAQWQATVTV